MNKYWTTSGYYEKLNYDPNWGAAHRLDGPAAEWYDGSWAWFKYGVRHREDGPAVYYPEETLKYFWYLDGQSYTLEEFVKHTPYLKTDGERTMFYLKWK